MYQNLSVELTWWLAFLVGAGTTFALSRVAPSLGLIDHPGGRKAHGRPIPLVGGLAVAIALFLTAALAGIVANASYFLLALSMVIAVGLWDDVAELSPRLKFAIQIVASAVMIWGAGIQLNSVGDLLGWRPIGLSLLAIPLTVFAIVGVVNAVNMVDGMDGLSGSITFCAFAWYAAVAAGSSLESTTMTREGATVWASTRGRESLRAASRLRVAMTTA